MPHVWTNIDKAIYCTGSMEIDGASLLKMHHGSFSLKWLLPEDESFGIVARILEYL